MKISNELDEAVTVIDHMRMLRDMELRQQVKDYLRFLSWKLYELYLVIKVLTEILSVSNTHPKDRKIVVEYNDRKLLVLFGVNSCKTLP
ncbi:MAG: hypothetical protein QXV81_05770 [Ignisphaera sp.]|uniref:Uncharacterized protein n=1 Tax=Ignisphaera aggregans TaxID=334771 RepID=A0A7J3JU67_9CREN